MTKRFNATATTNSGRTYEGTLSVANLFNANHSLFVTTEREGGKLRYLSSSQVECIDLDATQAEIDVANAEYEEEQSAKEKAWKEAMELSKQAAEQ